MTIDEAIENLRYDAQCNRADLDIEWAERNEQLAEWLEELNSYKLGECMNDCEHYDNCSNYIYSKGYTKAIEDFFDELQNYEDSDNWLRLKMSSIYQIAEQLKEGGNNG